MFKRKTLFVVGAGASAEVGLPVGSGLADQIARKLNIRFRPDGGIDTGDQELYDQVKAVYPKDAPQYQIAARTIAAGIPLANSIDDYLDLHRGNAALIRMGKAAIVKTILEAERGSKLYADRKLNQQTINFPLISNTWFVKFMRMLSRGIPTENAREIFDSVSFIIFNYDRCIEHFLFHALQAVYAIPEGQAAEILSDLDVIHPYGVVGELLFPLGRSDGVPFGGHGLDAVENYVKLSDQIRTYTEQMADGKIAGQISQRVIDAQCIVFLGFAYHSQNLNLLRPPNTMSEKPIFGTAFGMSDSDAAIVHDQLMDFFISVPSHGVNPNAIKLEQMIAVSLFDAYSKSLTGGD
jgi:hypothetical protein